MTPMDLYILTLPKAKSWDDISELREKKSKFIADNTSIDIMCDACEKTTTKITTKVYVPEVKHAIDLVHTDCGCVDTLREYRKTHDSNANLSSDALLVKMAQNSVSMVEYPPAFASIDLDDAMTHK